MKPGNSWVKMDDITHTQSGDGMLKNVAPIAESAEPSGTRQHEEEGQRRSKSKKSKTYSHEHFRVYKRRWFGLAQLCLLNIVVSWDVSRPFSLKFVGYEDFGMAPVMRWTRKS
jgi:hypothetical protein